jgi:pantetheine-phosphate adenylyltransferase
MLTYTGFVQWKAIYAGSFDPVTNGHLALVARARSLFHPLLIAIGDNPRKRYWFSATERAQHISTALTEHDGVGVATFDGLLVDFARRQGARVLIRAIRGVDDFAFEQQTGLVNRALAPDIETVLLLADPPTGFISSSMVREIALAGGDPSPFVPASVASALRLRVAAVGREARD